MTTVREPVEQLFPRLSLPAVRALKVVVGGTMRAAYGLHTENLDAVPSAGPAIVAANHVSYLDAPAITIVVPRRVTNLAKAEYWDLRRTRWLFSYLGQIPVHRDTASASTSVDAGLRVLDLGGLLAIHPEGTRSPDGRMYRAKTGVARLAAVSGAPVIPAGVLGSAEIFPRNAKRPRLRGAITIRFGEPMWFPSDARADDGPALRSFADDIMTRIRAFTGQAYVDEYNDASSRRRTAGLEDIG